jgi:hypothetical protein
MSKLFVLVCFAILLYAILITIGVASIGNLALEGLEPVVGSGMSIDILEPISEFLRAIL